MPTPRRRRHDDDYAASRAPMPMRELADAERHDERAEFTR